MTRWLLLAALAFPASAAWVERSTIAFQDDNSKQPIGLFFNTIPSENDGITSPMCNNVPRFGGGCLPLIPPDTWVTVDLSWLGVPKDAVEIYFAGVLIVTHGYSPEMCGFQIGFRRPGSTLESDRPIAQIVEVESGTRQSVGTWVPVQDGKYEVFWHRYGTTGDYPTYCGVAANLSLQAYVR